MRRRPRSTTGPAFDALTVEGALIAPAMLARIAARDAGGQADGDYRIPKGLTLRDEVARYYRIAQALFAELHATPDPSAGATVRFVEALLRDVFGFADIRRVGSRTHDGRQYAVTLEALDGRAPVVVVPPADALDKASDHLPGDGRRRSAATAIQDWLNAADHALWGVCCNGERLRLVRDNHSLTRPAYIEADLRQMLDGEAYADFTALWLLAHASRFGAPGSPAADCALERWREDGGREGVAARERLRDGVEAALLALGTGFLAANPELRQRVQTGELPLTDFFGQLLRLVYRLIFLLVAEDRGLLHPPGASAAARRLYAQGYSLSALRDRAVKRTAWDGHHDRWQGLVVVFAALARGEKRLGLPALGGLFAPDAMPDLEAARLSNRALMEAMWRLAWLRDGSGLMPVNWRDMETEELGSVYESLLELTPRLADDGRALAFAEGGETRGHARKTTGSYYTPDSLVQALLDSALDPVLDRVEAEADDPAAALLSVTVLDPACGSGHFLLAAARRIATRLARARTGGVAAAEDFRHALRDVARACIHGVDRNPMAVELTKVALWIETVEPGKPLGFLDANIRCGDALLGVADLEALRQGIPDEAYKPLTGDDKETARHFAKRNKAEKGGQGTLDFAGGGGRLPPLPPLAGAARNFRALPEDDAEQVAARRRAFDAARTDPRTWGWKVACDLYVAAFLVPKTGGVPKSAGAAAIPTSGDVWHALQAATPRGQLAGLTAHNANIARALDLAAAARAFHWPLEFPDVIAAGGFDVVLGNPPWEVMQLGEEEYFAQRLPEIAELAGAARKRAIAELEISQPAIFAGYQEDKRRFEASNEFDRSSGRFDLTARGKVNTYALFAELFATLAGPRGRAGVIVPTGIATDATTAPFFAALIDGRRLASLVDFENREGIFPAVHRSFKFSLLTVGREVARADFAFFLTQPGQLAEAERRFTLLPADIARINPNTKTAPVFRARADAELTAKIYANSSLLIHINNKIENSPFDVLVIQNFYSSSNQVDLELFARFKDHAGDNDLVPVLRGADIFQFDHRFAAPEGIKHTAGEWLGGGRFVPQTDVSRRLMEKGWTRGWLMGWRDICRSTDERTVIATILPTYATDDTLSLLLPRVQDVRLVACLLATLNSLCLDYAAQSKVGGTHIRKSVIAQFPILPPTAYSEADLAFIVPRVLELTYTSHAVAPFARDLGFNGPPFAWDEDRRAHLRAELDAWYARAYGLTRDELRYILDPADVMGPDYPSETFRVLKNNEIRKYGDYRTARLVLAAWDRMAAEAKAGVPA